MIRSYTRAGRHALILSLIGILTTASFTIAEATSKSNIAVTVTPDSGALTLGKKLHFRKANASYYGPGLFGNRTACGKTLTAKTVGVAHKTLSCGKVVTFSNHGHTVTAPVIDRGPYAAGREFDLTVALKNKLRFGSTGVVKYSISS